MLKDSFGRTIDYMRISVTDRCNLRCRYCMPNGIERRPMAEILRYEELLRLCRIFASLGVTRPFSTRKIDPASHASCLRGLRDGIHIAAPAWFVTLMAMM